MPKFVGVPRRGRSARPARPVSTVGVPGTTVYGSSNSAGLACGPGSPSRQGITTHERAATQLMGNRGGVASTGRRTVPTGIKGPAPLLQRRRQAGLHRLVSSPCAPSQVQPRGAVGVDGARHGADRPGVLADAQAAGARRRAEVARWRRPGRRRWGSRRRAARRAVGRADRLAAGEAVGAAPPLAQATVHTRAVPRSRQVPRLAGRAAGGAVVAEQAAQRRADAGAARGAGRRCGAPASSRSRRSERRRSSGSGCRRSRCPRCRAGCRSSVSRPRGTRR